MVNGRWLGWKKVVGGFGEEIFILKIEIEGILSTLYISRFPSHILTYIYIFRLLTFLK